MARMLGRERQSGCGNFGCRLCGPGDTRLAKRTGQRELEREIAVEAAESRPTTSTA